MTAEIVINWLGGYCPVQAEGTIDGKPFYFRARGQTCRVEIGERCHPAEWSYAEPYGEVMFAAGYIPEDEAEAIIKKAAELYRESLVIAPVS